MKNLNIEKVNEDDRGIVWKITSKKDFFISLTKKGFARGGDIHDGYQVTLVLEGKIKVLMMDPDGEKNLEMLPEDLLVIPKDIPHVFIADEDSIVLEWHEKPLPPYDQKKFYEPYRKLCK